MEGKMKEYDLIVVGTGAGNIVLEAALAKGLKCAQIEKGKFGGTCLTRGCIPTKVLVTAADFIREAQKLNELALHHLRSQELIGKSYLIVCGQRSMKVRN